jgi:transposase
VRISTVFRKLLGVTGLLVLAVDFEEEGLVIDVRPQWRKPRCGECGRKRPCYDRSTPRRWRHLALGRTVFWLRYAPRRVSCRTCGVRVEQVPWAAHLSRFTWDLEEMAAYLAQQMDKTAVCKLLGIDWRTVGTLVQRVVAEVQRHASVNTTLNTYGHLDVEDLREAVNRLAGRPRSARDRAAPGRRERPAWCAGGAEFGNLKRLGPTAPEILSRCRAFAG